MSIENLGDSVGKKIVEALKTQDDSYEQDNTFEEDIVIEPDEQSIHEAFENTYGSDFSDIGSQTQDVNDFSASVLDNVFNNQSLNRNNAYSNLSDFDYPTNVAILNNLIAKLPVGVSRQTGALIIRQTMEALGIPMSSVIQEAKQVQENLARKASECQQNIIDYKKQINTLELQSMQFQRQAVAMNDIIALFNS